MLEEVNQLSSTLTMEQILLQRTVSMCIDDWNQDMIEGVLSQDGIQWVFNPPAALHGGCVGAPREIVQESARRCPTESSPY